MVRGISFMYVVKSYEHIKIKLKKRRVPYSATTPRNQLKIKLVIMQFLPNIKRQNTKCFNQ